MDCDYSYHPLDVGFDLRRHSDMLINLPEDAHAVAYECGGERRVVSGPRERIVRALTAAGYAVQDTTSAAAVLGRKGGSVKSERKRAALARNRQTSGRHPSVPYHTRRHGAPFGEGGEVSEDVPTLRDADRYARSALLPGQRLDVLRGETVIARWACDERGDVCRVTL